MRHSRLLLLTFLTVGGLLGLAGDASAQFQLEVQSGSSSQAVSNGANVNVQASGVGQTQILTLTVTYTGTGSVTLSAAQLFGSAAFRAGPGGGTLNSGQSTAFAISYTPTSGAQVSSSLSIPYTQTAGTGVSSGTIGLSLTGTCPNFVLGYAIQPQNNAVPLSNGGTMTFPATVVGNSTTGALAIENTGSAPGILSSFTLAGAAFNTTGLPLLPGPIASGQNLQITVVYTPTKIGTDSGTIQLAFPGQNVTINLAGTGISSQLTFTLTQGNQTLKVDQNMVSLLPTPVGGSAIVSTTVVNGGNANFVVNNITLAGNGFQLTNAPPTPQTLAPGGSLNLTFTFAPPQAGNFTGALTIGGVTLTIAATGTGPLYQYSYTTGSTSNPVSPNGSVFFATVQLGKSSSTVFTITNTGTAPGTISGIYIAQANSPFTITGLSAFPVTIGVNQSITFGIAFSPTTPGNASATLQIDGAAFQLTGAGGPAPAFPAYSFTGPGGTLGPLQQPTVSLALATPYSVPVTGTLTMTVQPNGFAADPAIQFSSGGRTVAFSIPANTVAAVFPNGNTSIALQTGSTSGTITLTPTFQTASGVPLTPASSPNLQLVVPSTAPLLIGAQVTSQSAAGITLAISGVSNSQALTQMDFTFTVAPGFSVSGATATVNVASAAASWFASAAAQVFGGDFVVTIPFAFTAGSGVAAPTTAVTSVSITAANAQGTSAPVVVALP
jgi:Abnormal spindle-like microcephaly-assoc'd, ASPM-SPD-2-Hydin